MNSELFEMDKFNKYAREVIRQYLNKHLDLYPEITITKEKNKQILTYKCTPSNTKEVILEVVYNGDTHEWKFPDLT